MRCRLLLETMTEQPRSNSKTLAGTAIILLAAAIAVGPLLWRGPACGSDFGFHLVSWIDAEHSLALGVPNPHWANSPNFGAGEPRFVFYPPLSWMSGAVLGIFLPWKIVPLALFIGLLAGTGLANRALAREVMPDGPATLAGCAAIFLGYALFNVYKRCDFAELAGGFWIPLLLLYGLRRLNRAGTFWQRAFDGSATPLALVIAGAWLSNGPVALMACYLLAAVTLVSTLIERSLVAAARALAATAVGMGMASIYLFPAFYERSWASIQYAFMLSHFMVENSWLFAHHADPSMVSHDMLLGRVSRVAVCMLAIALGGMLVAWLRGAMPGERRWWLPLALIPPGVLLLLVPVSLPLWNLLPGFRLLQFPWRWLVVLEAPMAIFFAQAIWPAREKLRLAVVGCCAVIFAGISVAAEEIWFEECGPAEAAIQQQIRSGVGVLGKPEYSPPGVHYALVDRVVHGACLLDAAPADASFGALNQAPTWDGEADTCKGNFNAAMFLPEEKRIAGVADHAGFLILRLRYFPAWHVEVNGVPVLAVAERERGLMAVPVSQGNIRVTVNWTTTGYVIAGRWMSLASLMILCGLGWVERRGLRPHLK
jgi:hypothetical protein